MKKGKFFAAGMLAAALAFGVILAGCDNGVQEVEIKTGKASAPGDVQIEIEGNTVYISFDAVDNANQYKAYAREKGYKPITELPLVSPDIEGNRISYSLWLGPYDMTSGKTYEIGVQTVLLITYNTTQPSDVVWKEVEYK
jgi:hypothetical protein